jgi:hypothetical protein
MRVLSSNTTLRLLGGGANLQDKPQMLRGRRVGKDMKDGGVEWEEIKKGGQLWDKTINRMQAVSSLLSS